VLRFFLVLPRDAVLVRGICPVSVRLSQRPSKPVEPDPNQRDQDHDFRQRILRRILAAV